MQSTYSMENSIDQYVRLDTIQGIAAIIVLTFQQLFHYARLLQIAH